MKILKETLLIKKLLDTNKTIYLWGHSHTTLDFIKKYNLINIIIIDNNTSKIQNSNLSPYEILPASILLEVNHSLLVVHGNHCKAIVEQLKSISLANNIDVFINFDRGGEQIFLEPLYFNITHQELFNPSEAITAKKLLSQKEIAKNLSGGNILIRYEESRQFIDQALLEAKKIDFLQTHINRDKIYIGCGEDYRDGYLHCDKRDLPHVDIVCNAWEIDTKLQNISTIYSRHMLEHLTNKEAELTLRNWYKALKKDGYVEIIVPNFDLRAQQWLSCEWELDTPATEDEIWSVAGCWGWQRECDPLQENYNQSYWDVHKSGYNEKRITKILTGIGFKDITTKVDAKNNLIAQAYKR